MPFPSFKVRLRNVDAHASTLVVGDLSSINAFQKDHTFLEGIIVSIVISLVVKEIRRRTTASLPASARSPSR